MMKFSVKKFFGAFLLSAAFVAAAVGASGCVPKSVDMAEPTDYSSSTARSAAPTDGSLPTAHTAAENLSYICGVFAAQTQYHSYSYGQTVAMGVKQTTRSWKDYRDGVLITSDVTFSSMVKSSTQSCTVLYSDGDGSTYFRTGAKAGDNVLCTTAEWSEDDPTYYDKHSYNYTYGMLPTELFNYIVNEDTIVDSSAATLNADGTYSLEFTLDNEKSTFYYQFAMKTRGGLSGYPTFNKITAKVTFTSSYEILHCSISENTTLNKGFLIASTGSYEIDYAYGDEAAFYNSNVKFDEKHFSYYESYYKKYANSSSDSLPQGGVSTGLTIDKANVLANGFSDLLTEEGQQFEISASLGENVYKGYAYIAVPDTSDLSKLKIRLSFGKTLADRALYIEYAGGELNAYYGGDFALNVNLAETKTQIAGFGTIIKRITSALGDLSSSDSLSISSDALTKLMDEDMILTAGSKQAVISLESDSVLDLGIGIDADLVFGINSDDIIFRGANVGGITIGGEELDISLSLKTTTADIISYDGSATPLSFSDYVADVYNLLSSDLLDINLTLDGNGESVKIPALNGLEVSVSAKADIGGITLGADVDVAYTYKGKTYSGAAEIWYGYNAYNENCDGYGVCFLYVKELNGEEVSLKVVCDIEELASTISSLLAATSEEEDNSTAVLAEILNGAFSADFSSLIGGLYADGGKVKAVVSIDTALEILGVDTDVEFGTCALVYEKGIGNAGGSLSAALPAIGFTASVSGAAGEISLPDRDEYLDLADVISLVQKAEEQIDSIISEERLSFTVEEGTAYICADGVRASVWGGGEISWGSEQSVALDLYFAIDEDGGDKDVTQLRLVYKNGGEPLVQLALNDVGLNIYSEDITSVQSGLKAILSKLGLDLSVGSGSVFSSADLEELTSNDKIISFALGILAGDDWVNALGDITATCDGESFILSYLAQNSVQLGLTAEGGLTLFYSAEVGDSFALGGELTVSAADGFEVDFSDCIMSSSENGTEFARLAYNFLFDAVHSVSVENILGSDTYAVDFELIGDNCNISALENVTVSAHVYITGGSSSEEGKIADGELNVDVGGVGVKLNVVTQYDKNNSNAYFYIDLVQVADKVLNLKVMASQDSLYLTLKQLFLAVRDTNAVDFITGFVSTSAATAETDISDETAEKLADVLQRLINVDFSAAMTCVSADDTDYVEVDLDNLLKEQLGISAEGDFGTLALTVNHVRHSMSTEGKAYVLNADNETVEKTWIKLSSARTARKSYVSFEKSDYVNIEFLPDLIGDAVKFATDDDGNICESYTLSGSISATVAGIITLNIDICTLTANISSNGEFYVSGILHVSKVSALVVSIPESTIGFTYQNGYLTFAKGVSGDNPEYKIMTMEYFLDHLLTSGGVLEWWLDISGWSVIASALSSVDLGSGLTETQDVYLYDQNTATEDEEINMYSYVEALGIVIGGKVVTEFGDTSSFVSLLGLSGDYYGFALNAEKVTGGTLTSLYAALLRSDEDGLTGVAAGGAIGSILTFGAKLDYVKNPAGEYVLGTTLTADVSAPSLYACAEAVISAAGEKVDYAYEKKNEQEYYDEIFGCYTIEYGDGAYEFTTEYSRVLYGHTVTVKYLDGTEQKMTVRHGSALYLYDNASPVYEDENKLYRVIYSMQCDTVGEESLTVTADITVYAVRREAVNIIIHNGEEQLAVVCSFVGDKVPQSLTDYVSLTAVTYADGSKVSDGDTVTSSETLHLYGTFVERVCVVDCVKYEYDEESASYIVVGTVAGFEEKYCTGGATLYLCGEVNGVKVTAIAAEAFKRTDGASLKNVVVPASITTIGESAFADNYGMQSAVFLGENITFFGSVSDKTTPFYGCSTEDGGETASLVIYVGSVANTDYDWLHFRTATTWGIDFRKYIGDKHTDGSGVTNYDANAGGALYEGDDWDYVTAQVVSVDTTGVDGTSLTEEAAEEILARYYPFAMSGTFARDSALDAAIESELSSFDVANGSSVYKCSFSYTYEKVDGRTVVYYSISFKQAKVIYVYSDVAFTYYGVSVQAGVRTKIVVEASDELETPVSDTYVFVSWSETEEDGVTLMTATWREKAEYTFTITIKGNLVSKITVTRVSDSETIVSKNASAFSSPSFSFTVLEGQTVTVKNSGNYLYVYVDGTLTYTVYSASYSFKDTDYNSGEVSADISRTFKF